MLQLVAQWVPEIFDPLQMGSKMFDPPTYHLQPVLNKWSCMWPVGHINLSKERTPPLFPPPCHHVQVSASQWKVLSNYNIAANSWDCH